jgi:regulator of protease activity HflC (stomatin/prohibitin superfamily)
VTEILIVIAIALTTLVAVGWSRGLLRRVVVYEYERAVRYDSGRFTGLVEPGVHWILRRRSRIDKIDTRPLLLSVRGQEVLTKDGISIRASVAAEYEVVDPQRALTGHSDYSGALHVALQLALRELVATVELEELLERRVDLRPGLLEAAAGEAERLGVRLLAVELKDVMLSGDLKRALAQVVTARKEGLAALERARGETAALRNLANAARSVEQSPGLLQLRMLQELGRSSGNTVILGVPTSSTPVPVRPAIIEAPEQPEPPDDAA